MTPRTPSLILFLVALFFFKNPASAQSVTFRTVRECVNYQYDLVVKSLCASSNQCNVNLCSWVVQTATHCPIPISSFFRSPEYKSSDSYNQVVDHCEIVMQASPSVVEPIMQARCDQGKLCLFFTIVFTCADIVRWPFRKKSPVQQEARRHDRGSHNWWSCSARNCWHYCMAHICAQSSTYHPNGNV